MQTPGVLLSAVTASLLVATWANTRAGDWPPNPQNTVNLAGNHAFKVEFELPLEEIARSKAAQPDCPGPWPAQWQTEWKEEIVPLFQVPKDKWLVVTDYFGPDLYQRWGKVMTFKSVGFEAPMIQSYRAGLVFAPGTEVVARVTDVKFDRRAMVPADVAHQNLKREWVEEFSYMILGYMVPR